MGKTKMTNIDTIKDCFDFGVANSFDLDFGTATDMPERYQKPLTKSNKFNKEVVR